MSFFPQPDPVKLRAAMAQNYTIYQPSQGHSKRSRAVQPTPSQWPSSSTGDPCPPSQSASWVSGEPRGLGLMTLPVSSEGYYGGSNTTVTSAQMADSMAWTSGADMAPSGGITRKDSAVGHCNPLSTLLPASSMWSGTPASMIETSPGRSDQGTGSSRPSAVSTPYAQSDSFYPTAHSPVIKIEDPTDVPSSGYHYVSTSMGMDRSMLVHPGDLLGDASVVTAGGDMDGYLATSRGVMKSDYDAPTYGAHERSRASSDVSRATSFDSTYDEQRPHGQKRSFTTAANSTCSCERCGKLFQRSYNLKAHMETHDPNRDQPHACEYPGCQRKFVRRTDLTRHEQSVHLKIRNNPCHMCEASFARKDTLRRHIEDGCPRRPEVKKRGTKASDGRRRSLSQALHNALNSAAATSYAMDHGHASSNIGPYY